MKTAIYIEDGVVQLVITPESEFEKNALTSFESKPLSVKIFNGTFYDCQGGWARQKPIERESGYMSYSDGSLHDKSIILRIEES